ncbi:MAG: ABC transporter substrate-binding protein, partial [Erysipelotrichaceae bacterium]|nr:ABC transporter substrate-binding protein [Erysipelotrichaceae bacterium]
MRKKMSLVVLTMLMLLSLVACHGSKETRTFVIPEEFDTSRHYEISFWAKNDTNINQVNIYKKAIADFEELYP